MWTAVVVIGILATGCHCARWSPSLEEGATVYVCEGQDLTLPWSITSDTGEDIMDFTWFFVGQTDQMIAVYSHHVFFPMPSHSKRVKHLSNGGIALSHVTDGDAGKYKIKVTVHKAGGTLLTYNRTAVVHVASVSTARTDASVEVRQHSEAVYSQITGQFHLQLNCTGRGYPPPAVLWKTPSRQTLPSSNRDGRDTFSLLLPNPVSGGNYTCRVPPDSPPATCLPSDDPALEGATVFVDDTKARVTLLEARLTTENSELRTQITGLKADNGKLEAGLSAVRVENSEQKTQIAGLTRDVQTLKDVHSKRVIFHAEPWVHQNMTVGYHIKHDHVYVNQGNAYSPTTGEFTVPYSGYYYFTANAGGGDFSTSKPEYVGLYIKVDGLYVSHIYAKSVNYLEMGTCSYAGHLIKGQKVWLEVWNSAYFNAHLTTFSGFLVYPD